MGRNESLRRPLRRPPRFAGSVLPTLVLTALAAALPSSGSAQLRWNVEARGGVAVPTGDLADQADAGITAGVGAGIWVWPKVGFRIDAAWDRFAEATLRDRATATDVDASHFLAGVEVHLLEPGLVPVTAILTLHAGVAHVEVVTARSPITAEDHAPVVGAGLAVGYDVLVGLNVFVKGEVRAVIADGVSIQSTPVGGGQAIDLDLLGTMVSVPLSAGVRFDFFSR